MPRIIPVFQILAENGSRSRKFEDSMPKYTRQAERDIFSCKRDHTTCGVQIPLLIHLAFHDSDDFRVSRQHEDSNDKLAVLVAQGLLHGHLGDLIVAKFDILLQLAAKAEQLHAAMLMTAWS